LAAGCYFEKSTTTADGYIACRISKDTKEVVNHVATPFSAEIKNRMAQLHQTQDKVQGKKAEIYFRVKEIHTNSNLDLYVNGYFTYVYTVLYGNKTTLSYRCFDFVSSKLNNELKQEHISLVKTTLRNQSHSYEHRLFKAELNFEYITHLVNDNFYIIFPEDIDVFKGGDIEKLYSSHKNNFGNILISTLIKIDNNGKASQKMKIEERGSQFSFLKHGIVVDDSFYIINEIPPRKYRLGKLILK
jgi:hypothetical protein